MFNACFGQKNEFIISLNSGLFSFSGSAAKSVSAINYDDKNNTGYTNSPWGSQNGLCYGVSINTKRVTKKNMLLGVDLGFENLQSKISIDRINVSNNTGGSQLSATGKTYLNSNFINLFPYLGYRFFIKKISFDLTGGVEEAMRLSAYDQGSAVAENGKTYSIKRDKFYEIDFDFRPRVQLSSNFNKFGVYVGYSKGLRNYLNGYDGSGFVEGYASLIRFGVTYQLK